MGILEMSNPVLLQTFVILCIVFYLILKKIGRDVRKIEERQRRDQRRLAREILGRENASYEHHQGSADATTTTTTSVFVIAQASTSAQVPGYSEALDPPPSYELAITMPRVCCVVDSHQPDDDKTRTAHECPS